MDALPWDVALGEDEKSSRLKDGKFHIPGTDRKLVICPADPILYSRVVRINDAIAACVRGINIINEPIY